MPIEKERLQLSVYPEDIKAFKIMCATLGFIHADGFQHMIKIYKLSTGWPVMSNKEFEDMIDDKKNENFCEECLSTTELSWTYCPCCGESLELTDESK